MKGKPLQYLLLALVIIIWGIIAYRLYATWSPKDNYSFINNNLLSDASTIQNIIDSFDLQLNYADPFLQERYPLKSNVQSKKSTSQPKETPQLVPETTPSIIYKGYSVNDNSITRINILIDGKRLTAKPNSKIEDVLISKCYRDSIIIIWKGNKQTIYRN